MSVWVVIAGSVRGAMLGSTGDCSVEADGLHDEMEHTNAYPAKLPHLGAGQESASSFDIHPDVVCQTNHP
jgi:hypothetical protein